MEPQRGISIMDLIGWAPPGAQALLPDDVASFLENLAILDYHSMTNDEAFIHFGTVQAGSITLPRITGSTRPVKAPDLTKGVYFRLLFSRGERDTDQNVEPAPNGFVLDLICDPVAMEFDSFTPARFAPASGTTPAHLEPATEVRRPSDKPRTTRLFARGALRTTVDANGSVDITFIDFPDPFDAAFSQGPVFEAWFEPQHFFVLGVGMSVGNVIVDFSRTVTPPEVMARGQGPEWCGVAVEEAMVYLPKAVPGIGLVNFGVRDLLIGHPFGMQGEVYLELGQDPSDVEAPAAGPLHMFTEGPGESQTLEPVHDPADKGRTLFKVSLPSDGAFRVRAQLIAPPPDTVARWELPGLPPGGNRAEGYFTPVFIARPGDTLRFEVTRIDTVDGKVQAVTFDKRTFLFTGPDDSVSNTPSHKINVEVPDNASPFENVISISGSVDALEGVTLVASPGGDDLKWSSLIDSMEVVGNRYSLRKLNKKIDLGIQHFIIKDAQERTRRIIVHVLEKGDLVIGCQTGILDRTGAPLPAKQLKNQYDLNLFHKSGRPLQAVGETVLNDGLPQVPEGILAELTLLREPGEEPNGDTDGEDDGDEVEENARSASRLQILLDYDRPKKDGDSLKSAVPSWGDKGSQGADGMPVDNHDPRSPISCEEDRNAPDYDTKFKPDFQNWVAAHVKKDHDAAFLVVGRCDDIKHEDKGYNAKLARRRAEAVAKVIEAAANSAVVESRGEQDEETTLEKGNEENKKKAREALYSADKSIREAYPERVKAGTTGDENDIIKKLENGTGPAKSRLIRELYKIPEIDRESKKWAVPRPLYRRVDIVVLSKAAPVEDRPSTNKNELGQDPDLERRLIWVPGADAIVPTHPVVSEPKFPMLVQVSIGWDSPSISGPGDYFPTKCEVDITWVDRMVKIPGTAAPVAAESCKEDPTIPEFYKLKARFAHDARTAETVYTVGIESKGDPKGLRCLRSNELASTMALAPGLLPLLDDAGLDESGAKLAAMIALMGVASSTAQNGRFIIEGVEAELRSRGFIQLKGLRARLGFDYSVDVGWNLGPLTGTGFRIKYRNVGVLVNLEALTEPSTIDLDDVRLVFDEVSFNQDKNDDDKKEKTVAEVKNPGTWKLDDGLARLLRVTAARVGTGSAWIEIDLGLALDLGVISISGATLRATLTDQGFDIELRGLEVDLDVPGTLKGHGKLTMDAQGALSSAIELQIIPAGVSAAASLKLVDDFFTLFVDSRFSTALPLASTGLGIFGFNGHLVVNGTRALPAGDVVSRELNWYALNPEQRYQPKEGSWAVGLGTVVGTLPDEGFAFNAKGILAIEVPDLSVVLGVDGQFLKKPGPATAKGQPAPQNSESLRIIGLLAVDDDAVTIAMRGLYQYRRLLKVDVPVGAHFPIGSSDPYFLRIGSDGFPGSPPGEGARPGQPIKVTLLPGTLDAEASAYFMVEEKGLLHLGNRPELSFPGFAIGTGVKFELDWGNDLIGVEVFAELLAGIGFNPLTVGAGVFIDGEVFFLLLSAGIEGELLFRYVEDPDENSDEDSDETGTLSIRGRLCAKVGFWRFKKTKCGEVEIGEPLASPTPPSPVAGVDLVNRLDRVVGAGVAEADDAPTVWPDTIPVVHFSHSAEVALGADSAFDPGQIEGPTWVGSTDVQFAYRVTAVEIRVANGPSLEGPLPSVWSFPSHRGMFSGEDDPPTGDERRDLHLLSDHPFRWARNVLDGAENLLADPARSLERICNPTPDPEPVCAFGELARRMGPSLVRIPPRGPSEGPFPSYFELVASERIGGLDLSQAILVLADQGLQVCFGRVIPMSSPLPPDTVAKGAHAFYDCSYIEDRGQLLVTVPLEATYGPEVVAPELLLALCRQGSVQSEPGSQCATYEDLSTDATFQTLDHKRLHYEAIHGSLTGFLFTASAGGQRAIRYLNQGVRIDLPEAAVEVSATIYQKSEPGDDVQTPQRLKIEGFSSSGERISTLTDNRNIFDRNRVLHLRRQDEREITRVVLSGGSGRSHLVRFCYKRRLDSRVEDLLEEANQAGHAPIVRGTRTDGTEVDWTPTILPDVGTGTGRPACTYVLYRPPDAGEWSGVRVGPWRQSHVGVVRTCAITAEARRQRDEAEGERQDFIDDWNDSDSSTPSRFLLDSDTLYEVRVKWQAAAWARPLDEDGKPSKTETEPPASPDFDPEVKEQQFFFRTASEPSPLPEDAPINTEDESTFDPRKLKRSVVRLLPDHGSPPHFTEDPVRVAYNIGYIKEMLALYGRDLEVMVRRTDPPPGSQAVEDGGGLGGIPGKDTLPTKQVTVDFPLELLEAVDARVIAAVDDSNCLDPRPPEGDARELFFDLEPLAEYDLLITAPATADGDTDEVIIRKSHFKTSRFATPRALLDAFEFIEDSPGISLPTEILVSGTVPSTEQWGDEAFDETLVALGLDPLPRAKEPRLALLISANSGALSLVGILMEGAEPVVRDGRLGVSDAKVVLADDTSVGLELVRRNDAGTRLLFAVDTPTALADGSATMELSLSGTREGLVSGVRFLTAGGLALSEEVEP